MRYELKSISAWSYIKVMFFINLIVGFVLGIFYGIFTGAFISIAAELMLFPQDTFDMQTGFPIAVYVFAMGFMFSLGNAVFGTIFGAVIIGFYNLIVRMTGGLEFDLKPSPIVSATGAIVAQTSLESARSQPEKAKHIIPPPPPPVAQSPAILPPPPAPKEEMKTDDDKFKPPDYLNND